MKQILSSAIILVVFSFACNSASILGDDNKGILLDVDITGGLPAVQQNLQADQSGNAHFTDSFRPGTVFTTQLTESELGSLKMQMSENNFFQLSDSYIDSLAADAFVYTIFYQEKDRSKTVRTDGISVPENLETILEEIIGLVALVTENGLRL